MVSISLIHVDIVVVLPLCTNEEKGENQRRF